MSIIFYNFGRKKRNSMNSTSTVDNLNMTKYSKKLLKIFMMSDDAL